MIGIKNKIIKIFIILLTLIFVGCGLNTKYKKEANEYNLNTPIEEYNIKTNEEEIKYLNFIKKNIYPEKLRNFASEKGIITSELKDGNSAMFWMKKHAYEYLIGQMFRKEGVDYDICPLTNNFKNKFKQGLYNYFDLKGIDVICTLNSLKQSFTIEDDIDIQFGEVQKAFLHHFHYTLDEEGNIDDIIFDYTGWD